jgi:hypothetical protein
MNRQDAENAKKTRHEFRGAPVLSLGFCFLGDLGVLAVRSVTASKEAAASGKERL